MRLFSMGYVAVIASVGLASVALSAEQTAWPQLQEVIVVFKTHFDIGYTDMARDVVAKYRTTMIDKALDVCTATQNLPPDQQFVWTLPGWPLSQILYPEQTAERRTRLTDAMRAGRMVWHALPATTHTESLELEELVRGMHFSSDLSRSLGQPLPRDAKMTDVPAHCWVLPTILAGAGVEFMHIGTNRACTPPDAPPLFWWEGPGGARVMTMLVCGYGTGLQPPKGWPYRTWLTLMHTGDNHGPPTPAEVNQLIAQAAKELPGVKVRMGRLSDFADAIRREQAELPIVRADMPDTWIHGVMSLPIETGLARRMRPRIGQLEALNALMTCWTIDVPNLKGTIARAYEQSLLYGEHTWGMDAKRFPRLYGAAWEQARAAGKFAKLEESWAEHGGYIRAAAGLIEPALIAHLDQLAHSVGAPGPRVVVYNPLPWARDGAVTVEVPAWLPLGVRDAASKQELPSESTSRTIRFVARGVPSMGYKTYVLVDGAAKTDDLLVDAQTGIMENALLRVKLDAQRGGIVELFEKKTRRQLVNASDGPLGQYCYERFDADDAKHYMAAYNFGGFPWIEGDFGKPGLPSAAQAPRSIQSPQYELADMTAGSVSARATLTAKATDAVPHATTLTVTIYRDSPHVDLEWSVQNKLPTPWPEAGWLRLPLAVEQPEYRLARLGAVIDPMKDILPASNHDVFCLNGGLTVADANHAGVGVCPLGSPLVSLGQPGLWRYRKTIERPKPIVYVNLFNNVWSTNFAQWSSGTWSSRVRIWPTTQEDIAVSLIVPGQEARSPLLVATADGPAGSLPIQSAGIELSRPGVLVTAFGPNPDGPGLLLRVWDQAGQGGPLQVKLPPSCRFSEARPCDLRGQFTGPAQRIDQRRVEMTTAPYGPASVILAEPQ